MYVFNGFMLLCAQISSKYAYLYTVIYDFYCKMT